MRIVDQHIDAIGIGFNRRGRVRRVREIASKMGVEAAGRFDPSGQMLRRFVCSGNTHDVVARPGEGLGDIGAETFRRA